MNRYQTLERRFGALIVDLVVVVVPTGAVDFLIFSSASQPLLLLISWLAISNFANALYHLFLQGWYGQTLGKMLFRVKVVRYEDEGPIGMYRSFLREIPTFLFSAFSFFGEVSFALSGVTVDPAEPGALARIVMFLSIPWVLAEVICALKTAKRRAIHDFIAGTVVIRTDLKPTETPQNDSPRLEV